MEIIILVFFVIAAVVALWFFSARKTHKIPDANGLPTSRKVCSTAKNSARNAKRDRRRRNKKMMTQSAGSQEFTPATDRPIKTGQTANVSRQASVLPFDNRDMIVDTSSASELAEGPLIEVATDLPVRTETTLNSTERPCSLLSDSCEKNREVSLTTSAKNDGRTTTLRYIARSDIPRITGRGGRIAKLLEKRYGVKIDVPQGVNGDIVISGSNETTRLIVEENIRDRLIMTISLPSVDTDVRVAIEKLVSQGKLTILNKSFEGGSVTITGLARDCKAILNVPKFH